MLFLDGVYVGSTGSTVPFRRVKAPTGDEVTQLTIAKRIARFLDLSAHPCAYRVSASLYVNAETSNRSIENPAVMEKLPTHLNEKSTSAGVVALWLIGAEN